MFYLYQCSDPEAVGSYREAMLVGKLGPGRLDGMCRVCLSFGYDNAVEWMLIIANRWD